MSYGHGHKSPRHKLSDFNLYDEKFIKFYHR